MLQILIVTIFFILAFSLMAMALHFARWKKKGESGCCGGGHCDSNGGGSHSCYSSKINYLNDKVIKTKPIN